MHYSLTVGGETLRTFRGYEYLLRVLFAVLPYAACLICI